MSAMPMFRNRRLLIATKHQKEKVIAPVLEQELGVHCFVDEHFDTDTLGTFTGEVERTLDPITTVREKCLRAMRQNNCDLGVASEGSFGSHPTMFFVSADDEFLIFIDSLNNIEVIVRELSTSTNFNAMQVRSVSELREFAQRAGFPDHALILRRSEKAHTDIFKGVTDTETLERTFELLQSRYGEVYVETDMRAMCNPTRMAVIASAVQKLVQRIASTCPQCHMPGFGVTDAKRGLQCSLCSSPTNSILSHISVCQHCGFSKEDMYPNAKTTEDPMYCDYCNP